jgi:hypothetical protein
VLSGFRRVLFERLFLGFVGYFGVMDMRFGVVLRFSYSALAPRLEVCAGFDGARDALVVLTLTFRSFVFLKSREPT